mmetsp:Transcript_27299/g.44460  ORF Transcript_27299/g.44460 Transcript_27299/m.44460 type:complete len:410 (+) Transcript_27299:127-1356(+)|eukprot:CAMPEP_0184656924 /NCGR_PEP_ID=MMETSP0308-20130426/16851_1 /TAXON_ID=38269 /ORGANISM="Gloeochaete witrockiana, Strain SAG 46.84" /LENGTH=409 /DNA_ID=CAMNT_0027094253 /DNA_START=127 /DNA_END=1356 /DNA_ORIENTATION=-
MSTAPLFILPSLPVSNARPSTASNSQCKSALENSKSRFLGTRNLQRKPLISYRPSSFEHSKRNAQLVYAEANKEQNAENDGLWKKLATKASPLVLTAALTFASMCTFADPSFAARSGGRAGGSSFSRSAPSYRSSPPSSSYRSSPQIRSPTIIVPGPSYGVSPFGWGLGGWGYGGYGYGGWGAPAIGFGSGLLPLFVMGAVAAYVLSKRTEYEEDKAMNPPLTVAAVQVGLLAIAGRTLQADLERIARTSDTTTKSGLQLLLQETVLSLLRHPDYWVYVGGESNSVEFDEAEGLFNKLSVEERQKFQNETLSNVKGSVRDMRAMGTYKAPLNKDVGEYIVVTLLVATDSAVEVPKKIRSRASLQATLKAIGAIPASNIQAVEVLWSPEGTDEALSAEDFLVDYPSLRHL